MNFLQQMEKIQNKTTKYPNQNLVVGRKTWCQICILQYIHYPKNYNEVAIGLIRDKH